MQFIDYQFTRIGSDIRFDEGLDPELLGWKDGTTLKVHIREGQIWLKVQNVSGARSDRIDWKNLTRVIEDEEKARNYKPSSEI
jgi:hypothetical protein